jgi:hypothetical protein
MTTSATITSQAGDMSRRVAHRRTELGLSIETVAVKAGIDPAYLHYFESNSDARLSAGSLHLLALALDTTPVALQGGYIDRPPGGGRAGHHPHLETLSDDHCEAHLRCGGIGRVLYSTERGPVAVPVNYEFTDGQVIISTDVNKAATLESHAVVGFEIDRIDETMSEGWSVLVSGTARRLDDPAEILKVSSLDLESWAGGPRHALVAITPTEVTGRVIVHTSEGQG